MERDGEREDLEYDAEQFLDLFKRELSVPAGYLEPSEALRTGCLAGVELVFGSLKRSSGALPTGPLERLYTAAFDEEQVWEEVELANEPAVRRLREVVDGLEARGPGLELLALGDEAGQREEEGESVRESDQLSEVCESKEEKEEEEESTTDEEEWGSEVAGKAEEGSHRAVEGYRSKVDDEFFKLHDMEMFLEQAEQLSSAGSGGSVGALAEELSDSGSEQLHYQDFFDPPAGGGGGTKGKEQASSHEKSQLKLSRQIESLEAGNVGQSSWQMSGEVASRDRPINSLLAEAVDFDPMTAPAPVITEDTTRTLEDIIRQRILDQVWDDVQRKTKPPEKPYDYQRARPLNQEKSQRSLAEVYEEDYVRQTLEASQREGEGAGPEEDPRQAEVRELMKTLFLKLDALSNCHFTPKPLQPEVRVVSNVAAIAMEEVTPSAVAQHMLLAPEELQAKGRAPEKGQSEKKAADKRRQRLAKKLLKRRRGAQRRPLVQLRGSGVRVTRTSSVRQGRAGLGSSRQFFASLQQKASQQASQHRATEKRTTTSSKPSAHFVL